jgi:hypothetical protein
MIIDKLREQYETMIEQYEIFVEKKNKAAGRRARKAAGEIKKLITPFRKETMKMEKSMKK